LVGKYKVGLAQESGVNIGYAVTGVAGAVYKFYFNFGVAEQQAEKFSGGVAGATYNSYFYHFALFWMLDFFVGVVCIIGAQGS
jgi:hypothetical protein